MLALFEARVTKHQVFDGTFLAGNDLSKAISIELPGKTKELGALEATVEGFTELFGSNNERFTIGEPPNGGVRTRIVYDFHELLRECFRDYKALCRDWGSAY